MSSPLFWLGEPKYWLTNSGYVTDRLEESSWCCHRRWPCPTSGIAKTPSLKSYQRRLIQSRILPYRESESQLGSGSRKVKMTLEGLCIDELRTRVTLNGWSLSSSTFESFHKDERKYVQFFNRESDGKWSQKHESWSGSGSWDPGFEVWINRKSLVPDSLNLEFSTNLKHEHF
jgi:hypothetical protein